MGRRNASPQLWDYRKLSEATGVKVSTLRTWKTRGKLPAPDLQTPFGPAWWPKTIAPWAALVAVQGPEAVRKERSHHGR